MKRLPIVILLALSILLSACGAEATPTVDMAAIQNTAVAMAWTMAAQTAAAVPTNTPVPPTPTFTPTPAATPTPPFTPTPLPTSTRDTSSNPCLQPLTHWTGAEARVIIQNETGGNVTLSLCLYGGNAKGYQGSVSTSFGKGGTGLTLPLGCYSAYAWVNTSKKQYTTQGYALCMNNPDKWIIIVKQGGIVLKAP